MEPVDGCVLTGDGACPSQDELLRRNSELESLVRESHHRIQNNLQMIAGLVSMIDPEGCRRGIARCLQQIKAISLINEMLFCGNDAGHVELKEAVSRLADISVVACSCGRQVDVEVTGDRIRLPSRCVAAVGIAVNEILANAIEHGFTGRDKGRIWVQISVETQKVEVLIKDDGVGLPDGFTLDKSEGHGLKMIATLLKQVMNGDVSLESREGTLARILFSC